ncbi:MAG: class I SAM-dependent methyltransferase [Mucilaginibacter sp.]
MHLVNLTIENKHSEAADTAFGDLYIDVRNQEKRVLTDCQVMFLPDIESTHIHYKEWEIRKRSAKRLIDYLTEKNKPLNILEVGCGNGWLSSMLLTIKGSKVTGLDVNEPEIMQAKRLFKNEGLDFICAGFDPAMFADQKFDVILFAASIQYFPSLKNVLENALSCLSKNGEIHIVDTNFYTPNQVEGAARRTENYYTEMGYPEMAAYYFHHTVNELRAFNYRVLFNPHRLVNKIGKKDPFYWVTVKH